LLLYTVDTLSIYDINYSKEMDTDTVIVTNLTDDADFDFRKNSSSVRT